MVLLKTEKRESLAQGIFPGLRYFKKFKYPNKTHTLILKVENSLIYGFIIGKRKSKQNRFKFIIFYTKLYRSYNKEVST